MLQILAYDIPPAIVEATRVMYINTNAVVVTPEGDTDPFPINTRVLQGDPSAPFIFTICSDYVFSNAISPIDGLTLQYRRRRIHPEEVLLELHHMLMILFS